MGKSVTGYQYDRRIAFGIAELAEAIGVSKGFLRLEIARGHLRALHLGRRVVISIEEVERYLKGAS